MEQNTNSHNKEQPHTLGDAAPKEAPQESHCDATSIHSTIEEEAAFASGAGQIDHVNIIYQNHSAAVTSADLDKLYDRIAALGKSDSDNQPTPNSRKAALDEQEAFNEQSPELDHATRAQIAESQARCDAYASETWLKEWLAPKVFNFMQMWCCYVAIIFLVYFLIKDRDVPSEVMIALLTTTTVSIIGLVGFLVQGLFKSGQNKNEP